MERRPVDVIVAAVNALKVKSCWSTRPMWTESRWIPTGLTPDSEQCRFAPIDLLPTPAAVENSVSCPHRLAKARAASGKPRQRREGS
jgi:hypothetical protein